MVPRPRRRGDSRAHLRACRPGKPGPARAGAQRADGGAYPHDSTQRDGVARAERPTRRRWRMAQRLARVNSCRRVAVLDADVEKSEIGSLPSIRGVAAINRDPSGNPRNFCRRAHRNSRSPKPRVMRIDVPCRLRQALDPRIIVPQSTPPPASSAIVCSKCPRSAGWRLACRRVGDRRSNLTQT